MVRQNPDRDEVIAANGGADDPRRKYQFYKSGQKLPKTSKVRMRWCSEIFLGAGLAFFGGESEKRKNPETIEISGFFMELLTRFELVTSSLPRMRSTD